jgi:hypothetical protein
MTPESSAARPHPVWETLTIVLFLGLLWLPTVDYFFHIDHARRTMENRSPASWPQFKGLGQSREFITGVESYFNDHFGFRKQLVRWNNHWKGQLFHDSSGRDVLIGRHGWMFYSGDGMIDSVTREAVWSEQELKDWCRLLEMRRDWLRARGAAYLLVVPPDKHSVYSEYLPAWLRKGTKPSKIQQLAKYMQAHSTVQMLDLTDTLIEAKKIRVDYLKNDTHWNFFGGFVAYRAVMAALARQLPGLEPLPLEAYDWKPAHLSRGDLVTILGRDGPAPETQCLAPVPLKPMPTPREMYDPVRLPQYGVKETWTLLTLNDKASGKAMVFHDSFACCWYIFLGQHFKEVIYVWHYDWDRRLIEQEKPDVVIDEILERFFNLQDPVELARKDQSSAADAPRASR